MPAKQYPLSFKLLIALSISIYSCQNPETTAQHAADEIPVINYSVLNTYKHDTLNFTEGFFFRNGKLHESTGSPEQLLNAKSRICEVDLEAGETYTKAELDRNKYFGEGIASLNGNIYYLTYKNQSAFIYDAETYRLKDSFKYESPEGWGLTTDSNNLIMSDGSNFLTFIDSKTYKTIKKLPIIPIN